MRSATPLKNNIFSGCSADGSALGSGPRGRGFKSRHSDHKELNVFALGSLVFEHTASCQSRTKVRDQATEPSAACGGCNEAEEEKNRENCDAERQARRPLFFSVSRGFKSRHSGHSKSLYYQGFPSFFFLELLGIGSYFSPKAQIRIDICGSRNVSMAQPFLHIFQLNPFETRKLAQLLEKMYLYVIL